MALEAFHPAVRAWFARHFEAPTAAQARAWPALHAGRHTLVAAPTGSGKTLAAFLAAIDALVREGLEGRLQAGTRVLYVSPLKALSNDVEINLQQPLAGIRAELAAAGLPQVEIGTAVRTGDTSAAARERMRRNPPHILVTTPESLYLLLTSGSGRSMLSGVRTLIVDEIHALAGNKRGAHLALSLERLAALCPTPPVRVGLSATQKPIETMAHFLTGETAAPCDIIDVGHQRARDLALELPRSPLEAVMSTEVWAEVYDRLAELVRTHRSTLIFVNTRRLAERAARHLAERLGDAQVGTHHGSLAHPQRLAAEQRLKSGALRALVATASLELGIDVGEVDLVCQLGSPHAISTFLQRVGRSGHAVGGTAKGRLFPLSRDDLVECAALLDAVARGELEHIEIPTQPFDVLAQQIVAEVSAREWEEGALYRQLRRAWPYRTLSERDYGAVLAMLADGYTTRRGRRGAYLHRDRVNGRLRARRGARLTAATNGGAIPDQFDLDVILAPQGLRVGTVHEDFAFESLPGDIFQLGNTSYRIAKVEPGKVHVEDAHGQPPNMPFWFGEAPARSAELSGAVSRLRGTLDLQLAAGGTQAAGAWLESALDLAPEAAAQLGDYLGAARAALGALPTQHHVVLERFFDEAGDMHLVIHAPFGSRLNRAWGLALRKRFCRKFNFELQAAALEDSIVLSLGTTHSFALEEVAGYLSAATVRELLIQALLAAPMFATRWRWNASIALAVQRSRHGKRLPPQFQRMDAEDLLAVVFPDQLACGENLAGEREVPDHPLVAQTIGDCLHEAMDVDGLEALLRAREAGEVRVSACDLTAPSPLAQEILNARPYAFLDDAPAEERRTRAVQARRYLTPEDAADLGRLDPQAIARVRREAWPEAGTPDELHDALMVLGFVTAAEGAQAPAPDAAPGWERLLAVLIGARRAARVRVPGGDTLWVAAERMAEIQAACPRASAEPALAALPGSQAVGPEGAVRELLRSRLEGLGPVTAPALGAPLGLSPGQTAAALAALEQEGFALRGVFEVGSAGQWCERRLLARIHRYTLERLRGEIAPVSAADYVRFLFRWQHFGTERGEGLEALAGVLEQLEGFPLPASIWESAALPARLRLYGPDLLDALSSAGRFVWMRLGAPPATPGVRARGAPVGSTPIVLVPRARVGHWRTLASAPAEPAALSSAAQRVAGALRALGASFFIELVQETGLLRTQVEAALGELVAQGLVTCDGFAGLRALVTPAARRPGFGLHAGAAAAPAAGVWSRRGAGRCCVTRPRVRSTPPRRWSTSRGCCCAATAWCFAGCWSARPRFRLGASCLPCTGAWRRAASFAADASSKVSAASSSRCPKPWRRCARCARPRRTASSSRSRRRIRSTWWVSWYPGRGSRRLAPTACCGRTGVPWRCRPAARCASWRR